MFLLDTRIASHELSRTVNAKRSQSIIRTASIMLRRRYRSNRVIDRDRSAITMPSEPKHILMEASFMTKAAANAASRVSGTTPMRPSLDEPGLLLYRSNLLGADLRITNFGGGNTSAKVTDDRSADRRSRSTCCGSRAPAAISAR